MHFVSFLQAEIVQVVKILSYGRQAPMYPNTIMADGLVMQEARASAAMVVTCFMESISDLFYGKYSKFGTRTGITLDWALLSYFQASKLIDTILNFTLQKWLDPCDELFQSGLKICFKSPIDRFCPITFSRLPINFSYGPLHLIFFPIKHV